MGMGLERWREDTGRQMRSLLMFQHRRMVMVGCGWRYPLQIISQMVSDREPNMLIRSQQALGKELNPSSLSQMVPDREQNPLPLESKHIQYLVRGRSSMETAMSSTPHKWPSRMHRSSAELLPQMLSLHL